jgi:hypothetical protein
MIDPKRDQLCKQGGLEHTCIVDESLKDNSNFEESTHLLKVLDSSIPSKMYLKMHQQVGQYQVGEGNCFLLMFMQHAH